MDLFHGLASRIDRDPAARHRYGKRVASLARVLDVGGRNADSASGRWIRMLRETPGAIVSTDIAPDHGPDVVDDIARSSLPDASYDGIFCISILEHVPDYRAAVGHIRRILAPGGEVLLYVPFCYPFHDRTDHHRFTFTEVARLMEGYEDYRLCLADGNGYGGVLTEVLTFHQLHRVPWLWNLLSKIVNGLLALPLGAAHLLRSREASWRDFRFYYTHLHLAHGFWAWGRKAS
jgi:SAM-dependent methyltransferase